MLFLNTTVLALNVELLNNVNMCANGQNIIKVNSKLSKYVHVSKQASNYMYSIVTK